MKIGDDHRLPHRLPMRSKNGAPAHPNVFAGADEQPLPARSKNGAPAHGDVFAGADEQRLWMPTHSKRALPARRRALAAIALLCAAGAAMATTPAGSALAEVSEPGEVPEATVGRISPSFTPNAPGAPTALNLTFSYTGPSHTEPEPVRRVVVHLPEGLGIYPPRGSRTCSAARLQARGPSGCPAFAKVGSGSALVGAHLGTLNLSESATLTAWAGPEEAGNPTIDIAGQGLSPLEERVVINGVLEPDKLPYGMELILTIPPVPTLPTEPDASLLHFSMTLGSTHGKRGAHGGVDLIHVPKQCPAGGFPFAATFSYANGTSGSTNARVACP
jgi:hypothetical protein